MDWVSRWVAAVAVGTGYLNKLAMDSLHNDPEVQGKLAAVEGSLVVEPRQPEFKSLAKRSNAKKKCYKHGEDNKTWGQNVYSLSTRVEYLNCKEAVTGTGFKLSQSVGSQPRQSWVNPVQGASIMQSNYTQNIITSIQAADALYLQTDASTSASKSTSLPIRVPITLGCTSVLHSMSQKVSRSNTPQPRRTHRSQRYTQRIHEPSVVLIALPFVDHVQNVCSHCRNLRRHFGQPLLFLPVNYISQRPHVTPPVTQRHP